MKTSHQDPNRDEPESWLALCESRLQDVMEFCKSQKLNYSDLPTNSDRGRVLASYDPDLALNYKYLCLHAHSRPISVIGQHAPSGQGGFFIPANTFILEYYL